MGEILNNSSGDAGAEPDMPPSLSHRKLKEWKEMEEFYAIFHDGPFGYVMTDGRGYIQRYNEIAATILDAPDGNLRRKRVLDFLYEDGKKKMMALMGQHSLGWLTPLRLIKTKCPYNGSRLMTYFLKGFVGEGGKQCFCILLLRNDFRPDDEYLEQHEILYKTIVQTQEAERAAISASLHDTVAQYLYGIHLHLQHLQMNGTHDEAVLPVQQMLHEAIRLIRDFSNDLAPMLLRDNGLYMSIMQMVNKLSLPSFKINAQVDEKVDALAADVQLSIFRIVQELINNGMRHAQATAMSIRINEMETFRIEIEAVDNGRGFEMDENNEIVFGSGLRNIQNRVLLHGGELEIRRVKEGAAIVASLRTNLFLS